MLRRRSVRLVAVLMAALVLLAGCASDRAYDQDQARMTAETTQNAIINVQATFAANRYASPTLTATATTVPPAILHEIGLATSVQGNNQPNGIVTGVATNAGRVYVVADLDQLAAGSSVGVDMLLNEKNPEDQTPVGSSSITVDQGGRQWVAVPINLDGSIRTGPVAVYLSVDGVNVGSLGIEILSPGSQPQGV